MLLGSNLAVQHFSDTREAIEKALPNTCVMILSDGYPKKTRIIEPSLFALAFRKKLRIYLEFPAAVPGLQVGGMRETKWERAVVSSNVFAPDLSKLRILGMPACRYVNIADTDPLIVMGRVAGFDSAVYGLPQNAAPILFRHPKREMLIATTKLSQFMTGRFAPMEAWSAVWRWILRWCCPKAKIPRVAWVPRVRTSYLPDEALPRDAERNAALRGGEWFINSRILIDSAWQDEALRRLKKFPDGTGPGPRKNFLAGDGSLGLLEGASSKIHHDGRQDWRYHIRNDCIGESSMAIALAGVLAQDKNLKSIAANLNDFIYFKSIFAQGPRANPESPSYGLLSWDSLPPADGVYYGDDNARSMMGTMLVSGVIQSGCWDEALMKCLLANLRTTGPLGFRGNRLDEAGLQKNGWQHYWTAERTNYAPHYESWLWACFLWAYSRTRFQPFLERALAGIRMTMDAYPDEWHWTNGIQQERARMLLPLAWLLRVDDRALHRKWLKLIAKDILAHQDLSGAIREELGSAGHGSYGPPASNEAYGTAEAPLIQKNGDPLCDLLYTTNFAFAGLHEAAAATGDSYYRKSSDKLAAFLCRIQIQSEKHPELAGGWFRAFDFNRWDYWASNADLAWGAWCIESGWTQAWITSVLAMRELKSSLWDLTAKSRIARHLKPLIPGMLPGLKLTARFSKT